MITLYVLFAFSIFCPIYTYAIYPMILKIMKGKDYKTGRKNQNPPVTVVIIGDNPGMKLRNVLRCDYEEMEIIKGGYEFTGRVKGEIILFTDTKTELDIGAIQNIVQPFEDERVGCVVGQQTNLEGNSVFWRYENLVKKLESRIGCVSGATESIFAVRKTELPVVGGEVLNKPFYIATKITENGKDVVFQDNARTYEGGGEGTNFTKHVQDAAGYWQALKLFPKMLLPCKESFVYISHRVMKCFVWLNMVTMLATSGILAMAGSICMMVLFGGQLMGYMTVLTLGRKSIGGAVGKIVNIGYYFVILNVAYFVGMFR